MGCINSKPASSEIDEEKKSESIEFTESKEEDIQESKVNEEVSIAKDGKKENEKFHVETETTNILISKRESFSQNDEKLTTNSAPPPPHVPKTPPPEESPKTQRQRNSIESSSDKKLKLSELLHAEKMKKTSGSISSSGEVITLTSFVYFLISLGKRRMALS
jgi:hypothetical protein